MLREEGRKGGGREGGGNREEGKGEEGEKGKRKTSKAKSTTGLHTGPPSASREHLRGKFNTRETRFSAARYWNILRATL